MTISEETIDLIKLATVKIKDKLQLVKTFNVGVRSVYRILNGFITSNFISKRITKQKNLDSSIQRAVKLLNKKQ